jgi:NitT/TauT family transport system ATP-binding protein
MNVEISALAHEYQIIGKTLRALLPIDLKINSGEFVAVIGPSGCGKSTLLHLLAGLHSPTEGKIRLDGQKPQELLQAKRIGWMAQNPALLPWRTVLDNIHLAQQINPQKNTDLPAPVELLSLVGLSDFGFAYPFSLSGGMQHRVALARTLALGASLWLMDEPFASLDELTRETLGDELLNLWMQFRPTVVWVTHNIHEAVRLADRVLVLSPRPGRIIANLQISLERPRQETCVEFVEATAQLKLALRKSPIRMEAA